MGSHFGMRQNYQEEARNIIISLINDGYKKFYCGTYGDFDFQINSILYNLKKDYPDIIMICVKPYYNANKFLNCKTKETYQTFKAQILNEYENYDNLDEKLKNFEENYQYELFNNKFLYEKYIFDDIIVCDLDKIPYKFRIIECNKWKIKNSDVFVTFCTSKYSNTYKMRQYALKLNKKIVDISNDF